MSLLRISPLRGAEDAVQEVPRRGAAATASTASQFRHSIRIARTSASTCSVQFARLTNMHNFRGAGLQPYPRLLKKSPQRPPADAVVVGGRRSSSRSRCDAVAAMERAALIARDVPAGRQRDGPARDHVARANSALHARRATMQGNLPRGGRVVAGATPTRNGADSTVMRHESGDAALRSRSHPRTSGSDAATVLLRGLVNRAPPSMSASGCEWRMGRTSQRSRRPRATRRRATGVRRFKSTPSIESRPLRDPTFGPSVSRFACTDADGRPRSCGPDSGQKSRTAAPRSSRR